MTDSSIDFIKKLDTYWDTKIYDSMPEWLDVYEGNHGDDTTEKDYGIYRKTLEQLKEIE